MFGHFWVTLDNVNVFDCVADRGCRVINYCFPALVRCPTHCPLFSFTALGRDGPGWAEVTSIQEGWQPLPLAGQLTVAAILRAQPRPRTCLAAVWPHYNLPSVFYSAPAALLA